MKPLFPLPFLLLSLRSQNKNLFSDEFRCSVKRKKRKKKVITIVFTWNLGEVYFLLHSDELIKFLQGLLEQKLGLRISRNNYFICLSIYIYLFPFTTWLYISLFIEVFSNVIKLN